MAFIDTQLYIHQMISVKNFILAADVMKSISLLRYQEESKTLSLVSRVRLWPRCPCLGRYPPKAPLTPLPTPRMPSPWRCTAWTSWWTTPSWVFWVCGQGPGELRLWGWPGLTVGLCSPVSDRDRNLMVYMYLPEGECFLHPLCLGWVWADSDPRPFWSSQGEFWGHAPTAQGGLPRGCPREHVLEDPMPGGHRRAQQKVGRVGE